MKLTPIILIAGVALLFVSCSKNQNDLIVVNSKSFAEKQIVLDASLSGRLCTDSLTPIQEQGELTKRLDELNFRLEKLMKSESDSSWVSILKSWDKIRLDRAISAADTTSAAKFQLQKWAELNIKLLKFSGEERFADALEKILFENKVPVLTEKELKSVVFTHVYDQIFVNLLATSSLTHNHTTGGIIKLTEQTSYPESSEMTLKCESNDVRYLDVFIRIPEWAVNPTVTHGNVKYVAHPGEYCQISRKWNDGDEINVRLKN